jgi:hypothetical protein
MRIYTTEKKQTAASQQVHDHEVSAPHCKQDDASRREEVDFFKVVLFSGGKNNYGRYDYDR